MENHFSKGLTNPIEEMKKLKRQTVALKIKLELEKQRQVKERLRERLAAIEKAPQTIQTVKKSKKAIARHERSRSVASYTPMQSLSPRSVVEQEEDGDEADAASIVDHTTEATSALGITSDYDMASNADAASVTNDSESEGEIDSESDTGESNEHPSKFVKMIRERYADDASMAHQLIMNWQKQLITC